MAKAWHARPWSSRGHPVLGFVGAQREGWRLAHGGELHPAARKRSRGTGCRAPWMGRRRGGRASRIYGQGSATIGMADRGTRRWLEWLTRPGTPARAAKKSRSVEGEDRARFVELLPKSQRRSSDVCYGARAEEGTGVPGPRGRDTGRPQCCAIGLARQLASARKRERRWASAGRIQPKVPSRGFFYLFLFFISN